MDTRVESQTTLSVELKSELAELEKVRNFCCDVYELATAQSTNRENDQYIGLQLALNEAVANVMEHGYQFEPDQAITCFAHITSQQIVFDIVHDGNPFNGPQQVPEIDHPLEGGMGLFLIQQCVDHVSYCQTNKGRQCIRLTISIS